jgi:hypothetical protein
LKSTGLAEFGLWETVGMKKPHLIITDGPLGLGLRGTCSSCPETEFDTSVIGKEQGEATLQAIFDVHFKTIHLREDASQAAARIVKEATEND